MNSNRRTAIIVGVLFITATVTSSLYYVLVTPILDAPDYLVKVSENANQIIIGVLLYLIDCAAVVGDPAPKFFAEKEMMETDGLKFFTKCSLAYEWLRNQDFLMAELIE